MARLDRQTADQRRLENIVLGQDETERKRLNMQADGALEPKLEAFIKVQQAYVEAIKGYASNWVPSVVMGGGNNSTNQVAGGGAVNLINLLMAQTAR